MSGFLQAGVAATNAQFALLYEHNIGDLSVVSPFADIRQYLVLALSAGLRRGIERPHARVIICGIFTVFGVVAISLGNEGEASGQLSVWSSS